MPHAGVVGAVNRVEGIPAKVIRVPGIGVGRASEKTAGIELLQGVVRPEKEIVSGDISGHGRPGDHRRIRFRLSNGQRADRQQLDVLINGIGRKRDVPGSIDGGHRVVTLAGIGMRVGHLGDGESGCQRIQSGQIGDGGGRAINRIGNRPCLAGRCLPLQHDTIARQGGRKEMGSAGRFRLRHHADRATGQTGAGLAVLVSNGGHLVGIGAIGRSGVEVCRRSTRKSQEFKVTVTRPLAIKLVICGSGHALPFQLDLARRSRQSRQTKGRGQAWQVTLVNLVLVRHADGRAWVIEMIDAAEG